MRIINPNLRLLNEWQHFFVKENTSLLQYLTSNKQGKFKQGSIDTHFTLHHNFHFSTLHNVEAISLITLKKQQPIIIMINDTIASVRALIFSCALLLKCYNYTCCESVCAGSFRHDSASVRELNWRYKESHLHHPQIHFQWIWHLHLHSYVCEGYLSHT